MLRRLASATILVVSLAAPAFAQDAADFVVRLNRLENQVRAMSGQIEQLQFENRQLKEQARKFQEDVEYRFQEGRGGAQRPAAAPTTTPTQAPTQAPTPAPPRPARRGDAFDPGLAPNAPGAPQQLGSTQPSAPLAQAPLAQAPLAQPGGALPSGALAGPQDRAALEEEDDETPGGRPLDIQQLGRSGASAAITPPTMPQAAPPSVAATGSADPRADYEVAYAYVLQKQYEQAEMGFRQFLQSHPRDRLVPDATFWLGETYLQRNRPREAAEQFLKISTQYGTSTKAPDAMLRLGVSLNALGAREQACATLAELERKYPQAPASVRQGAEREQKRARCGA